MTDFDAAMEKARTEHWAVNEDKYSHDSIFLYAATWGHKWASKKGMGHLNEWMQSAKRKQLERNLMKIKGMAGHPDSGGACRIIIEYCNEVLATLDAID